MPALAELDRHKSYAQEIMVVHVVHASFSNLFVPF